MIGVRLVKCVVPVSSQRERRAGCDSSGAAGGVQFSPRSVRSRSGSEMWLVLAAALVYRQVVINA